MKYFGAPNLLLAALLIVSIASKAAFAGPEPEDRAEDSAATAAEMLHAAGFETRLVRLVRSPRIVTVAERPGCRIVAGFYPPHSTFRDVWQNLASPVGRLRFAWRGRLYEDEPKLGSLFDFYRWRELRRIGVPADRSPVIAVASSPGCPADILPWALADHDP